ncbi:hypothetical protein AHF37_12370, partial [Paragonimus kellicotti]
LSLSQRASEVHLTSTEISLRSLLHQSCPLASRASLNHEELSSANVYDSLFHQTALLTTVSFFELLHKVYQGLIMFVLLVFVFCFQCQ